MLTRRDFLAAALAPALSRLQPPSSEARLLGSVPLHLPGRPVPPLERLIGAGLDARLATDLSSLGVSQSAIRDPQSAMVTPNERYYIRTSAPADLEAVAAATPWTIAMRGRVQSPAAVTMADLERLAVKAGPYVMECAGNADPTSYGLMSAAAWEGAPLGAVLDRVTPTASIGGAHRVLVTGMDDPGPAATSVPGASWIFSRDQLERAILAVRMNDRPLPRNHGSPVRLIVPGWYGCACIKWVNAIELVPDDAQPTSQMWEFARRTHQNGVPQLARDYEPPVIDTAATPIRIEKWTVDGKLQYRVIGIIWGGRKGTNALSIRFRASEAWTKVDDCPLPKTTDTWSLWTHTWKPAETGRYQIVLRVDEPAIRTRRLDLYFYTREVEITEV